jgi:hypothetical protein
VKWKQVYEKESRGRKDLYVVLLGRPYTILSRFMNKGILDIFASLGVRVFFQDMLSCSSEEVEPVRRLLDEIHWHYASEILKAARWWLRRSLPVLAPPSGATRILCHGLLRRSWSPESLPHPATGRTQSAWLQTVEAAIQLSKIIILPEPRKPEFTPSSSR